MVSPFLFRDTQPSENAQIFSHVVAFVFTYIFLHNTSSLSYLFGWLFTCFQSIFVLFLIWFSSLFSRMKIANFDFSKKCQQIAEVTEGLSGREISKIAIAWQVSFEEIAGEMVFIQVSKMNQNFFGIVLLRFVIN